jgi:endonuclease YncB( thermonuclease family)
MLCRTFLLLFLFPGPIFAQQAKPAQPFLTYEGCTYLEHQWNDGDSFHVRMPDGKEQILRLYFVDTPEAENSFPARVGEQGTYFGITPEQTIWTGKEASAFTKATLSKPFTVLTRWHKAPGRSKLPRYYAFVRVGRDYLQDMLVNRGLVRIYGSRTPLPDGRDSRTYRSEIEELEKTAKAANVGAWKYRK